MTDLNLNLSEKIVSRLNRANSEESLSASLRAVLPDILAMIGVPDGAIRINISSDKSNISYEACEGRGCFCFAGMSAPDCVCGGVMSAASDDISAMGEITDSACLESGFNNAFAARIPFEDENAGVFLAVSEKVISPAPDNLKSLRFILRAIADTSMRILENKVMKARAADLETVNTVGRLITSKLTLKDMVREIVERLGAVMETDEVNVVVYDEAKKELSFLASYFADGSNLERPEVYPLSDGMNSWIIKNRKPLLMKYDTEEECRKLGIRHGGRPAKSWLGAPMLYKDRVVGVLSVQSYSKTGLYGERSAELLNAVARQCAVAVENARLFEEVIEREGEKELLYFSLNHDLLSLLSPVLGYAKLLQSLPEDTDKKSYSNILNNIINSTDRISRFVEDILVYAKIKSGKLALNIERADVLRVAEFAVQTHLPELAMRRIGLKVNGAPVSMEKVSVPGRMEADFDRAQIERVFLNLVGNAVKHARSAIGIDVRRDGPMIVCGVSDDGPGVSEDEAPSLFKEYYQSGAKKKGVGLGLPTVKKIVELHHGAIRVVPGRKEGFTIEFSWPRTLAQRSEAGSRKHGVIEA